MAYRPKIRSITIIGRRWHHDGSTYCTSRILVNGRHVQTLPYQYGYDSAFEQYAVQWLKENGYVPADEGGWSASHWCRENDIEYVVDVVNVYRKSDLHSVDRFGATT